MGDRRWLIEALGGEVRIELDDFSSSGHPRTTAERELDTLRCQRAIQRHGACSKRCSTRWVADVGRKWLVDAEFSQVTIAETCGPSILILATSQLAHRAGNSPPTPERR